MRTKLLLTGVMMVGLALSAWAVDFTTVNQESMQAFIELFPQYRALLEKFDIEYDEGSALTKGVAYKAEIDALFNKFGITWEDFAKLLEKVSMGYANAQMKESGMPAGMLNMMSGQMGNALSSEEMGIIEQNMDALNKAFE